MVRTGGPMRAGLLLALCLALVACDQPRRPAAAEPLVPTTPTGTVTPTPPPEQPDQPGLEPTL